MANTGKKSYNTLVQVYVDTGLPTGVTKANDPADADYIAPGVDLETCPVAAPTTVHVNKIQVSLHNLTRQAISLSQFIVRAESVVDPVSAYAFKNPIGILPNTHTTLPQREQLDDFSRVSFTVAGLSNKVRTKMVVEYKTSTTSFATIATEFFVEGNQVLDTMLSTARDGTDGVNEISLTFTEEPLDPNCTNHPPVVNAGANVTVLQPFNSVTLSGTATDADGTISYVTWSQVSGPKPGTIVSPDSLITVIKNLDLVGEYVFKLKALDNLLTPGEDTVSVVVGASNNPNGDVNVFVEPSAGDAAITSIKIVNQDDPSVFTELLSSTINVASGVKVVTGVKGLYRFEITVTGTIAGNRGLDVSWNQGSSRSAFTLLTAGVYSINNVNLNEGLSGILITLKGTAVANPTIAVKYAKLTVAGPTLTPKNILPNGLIEEYNGNIKVSFYEDSAATIQATYTGGVRFKTVTTNHLTIEDVTERHIATCVSKVEVILGTIQERKVYDYTQVIGSQLVEHLSYIDSLEKGEGYLIVP